MTDPEQLITAWLHGSLTVDQQATLDEWLNADDEHMRLFTDAVMFDQQIQSATIAVEEQTAGASFNTSAVGTPAFLMRSFAQALDDSMRAALAEGPKMGRPLARNRSTIPLARGASGPTTVRSMDRDAANPARASVSPGAISTACARSPIPPLGWVAKNSALGASCFSFQRRACSLPPFPTMKIRMDGSDLC